MLANLSSAGLIFCFFLGVDLGLLKAELPSTSATSDEADSFSVLKLFSVCLSAIDGCGNCSLIKMNM